MSFFRSGRQCRTARRSISELGGVNSDMVPVVGLDLRCGAGRLAALTCPRHVIHYRSRSSPDPMAKRKEGTSPSLLLVPVVGLEPTRCRHQRILSPSRLPFHHTGVSLSSIYHPEGKFKRKRFTHQIRGRTGKKRRSAAASSAERKAEKTRPTRWPRASRSVSARTAIV